MRRRVGFAAALALVSGLVTSAVLAGNTADAPPPLRAPGPVQVAEEPAPIALSRTERREILATARLFVASAVRRERPERAWPLASRALRSGEKLAAWKAGTMPVEPYPVRDARSSFAYAVRGEVGLDVWVDARDAELSALVYRLTLVRERSSWLVDSWTPLPSANVFNATPYRSDSAGPLGGAIAERVSAKSSALWVLAPFVVLLLALLVPAAAAVGAAHRGRRSRAAWSAASAWPGHDRAVGVRLPPR